MMIWNDRTRRAAKPGSGRLLGAVVLLLIVVGQPLAASQQGSVPESPSGGEWIAKQLDDRIGDPDGGGPTAPEFDTAKRNVRFETESYAIVVSNRGTRISAIDARTKASTSLDVPSNIRISSVCALDFAAAVVMRGKAIDRLIVYNSRIRKWSTFRLPKCERPIEADVKVGNNVASFQLKDRIIAYSLVKDRWGMLVVRASSAAAAVGDDSITAASGRKRSVFTGQSGAWAIEAAQAASAR
jgi:hypothetical protein